MPSKDWLLAELDRIIDEARHVPVINVGMEGDGSVYDVEAFSAWKIHAAAYVAHLLPQEYPLRDQLLHVATARNGSLSIYIGHFSGLRNAIERGLLDSIVSQVRDEVSADDLSLAESVLNDCAGKDQTHIAAAVIAGATLERALRAKCPSVNVDINKANGERKSLNGLIDDLAKAGAFNQLRAKQMRAWADIRNNAAHGDFGNFTREDVISFLRDLPAVLADLK